MNLKKIALAALLAASTLPAFADDQAIDLSSGAGSFLGAGSVLSDGSDKISFTQLASGMYRFVLSLSAQNIAGLGVTVNGTPAQTSSMGPISFAGLEGQTTGPIEVIVSGTAGKKAMYSGELTVTAVPEPTTYALMLAGLGAIGFMARRRRQD